MDKQCWLDEKELCDCSSDENCKVLFSKYAKIVYCNDTRCAWNVSIPFKKYIKHGSGVGYVPFKEDGIVGVCGRSEIGLQPREYEELHTAGKVTTCSVRSDRSFGHLDFSRFPQGGNIPDPVDPSAAYLSGATGSGSFQYKETADAIVENRPINSDVKKNVNT